MNTLPEKESDLVAAIVETLQLRGYIVQRCNQQDARRSGSDVLPDLFVTHPDWPLWRWLGMEVKTSIGRVGTKRPGRNQFVGYSQKDLLDFGRIVIVRSVEAAIQAVCAFENYFENNPSST